LSLIPGMQGTAALYEPNAVEKIQTMVADDQRNLLLGLLFAEAEIIKHAIEAGDKIAKFISTAPNKPSEAIKALAEFGSKITGAFNKDVTNAYIGGAFRPMGTALFIEAAKSIDPSLANVTGASAMLNLTVLKPQAQIPDYLNGDEPEKKDILTSHPLVNL